MRIFIKNTDLPIIDSNDIGKIISVSEDLKYVLIENTGSNNSSFKFPVFEPNHLYSYRNVIMHNDIIYYAKKSFESLDTFDINDWSLASGDLKSTIQDLNSNGIVDLSERALIADLAKESELLMNWKPNTHYTINQQVLYLDKIYSINTDHTSPNTFDKNDPNLTLVATGIHNDMAGLQGGKAGQYYHITEESYNAVSKIKADTNNDLKYGDKYIGDMVMSVYDSNRDGIVNKAHTLEGLLASINELNYLKGVSTNVQDQLNSLTSITNFTQATNTYADLLLIKNPKIKDMTIVKADETNKGASTIYVYNGTSWDFICLFTSEMRNFLTNPLDIISETEGILPEERIPDTIARSSDIIQLSNAELLQTYTATNINILDAISKKHPHNNLELLNSYNQTNADLSRAVKQMHPHTNISILNGFSEDTNMNLLYRGKPIGGNGGAGITDLNNFTTADLADSLNRRYITDSERANINSLNAIISDQSNINLTLNNIKTIIPIDAAPSNKLISQKVMQDLINNTKFTQLSDVNKDIKPNAFVITNNEGGIDYKQDISDLINFKSIIDKDNNNFKDVSSLKFSNLKGTQDPETNELILEPKNIFSTDISDMPSTIKDGILISNQKLNKYEIKSIDEIVDSRENFSISIAQSEWGLDDISNKYTKVVKHNLISKNLIISAYDGDYNNINLNYKIMDENNVLIISDSAIDCRIVINCSQGTSGSSSGSNGLILPSDFIDDLKSRMDRTYSSENIEYKLNNYAIKSNVYTKNQSDAKYSLKENEHVHNNMKLINKLSEDINGNIYYGDKKIMTEFTAFTYQKSFIQESHMDTLDTIVNINEIFNNNNYSAILQTEFTIRNNITKLGTSEDTKPTNQLHLVIVDGSLTTLDVYIKPSDTQKYLLGISPNLKIMVQGTFDANLYMTAY